MATPIIEPTVHSKIDGEQYEPPDFSFYAVLYQEIGSTTYGSNLFTLATHTELDPATVDLISTPFSFIQLTPTRVWADTEYKSSIDGTQGDLINYELIGEGYFDFAPEWLRWRASKHDYSNISDWGIGLGFAYENLWLGYYLNSGENDRINFSGNYAIADGFAFADVSYVYNDAYIDGEVGFVFGQMDFLGGSNPVVRVSNHYDDWLFAIGILVEWDNK